MTKTQMTNDDLESPNAPAYRELNQFLVASQVAIEGALAKANAMGESDIETRLRLALVEIEEAFARLDDSMENDTGLRADHL